MFFTATPNRTDEKEITTDGAINAKGYTYHLTRDKAIKKKLIREIEFDQLPNENGEYKDLGPPLPKRSRSKSANEQGMIRLKFAEDVLKAMKTRLDSKNRDQPLPGGKKHAAIVIAKNIVEANEVRDLCTTDEIGFPRDKVKVMHSNELKKPNEKDEAIQAIQNGNIEIVIIVKMLLEGFDYPPLSIAGIVTAIRSPVKFAQFIGRVQRLVSCIDQDGKVKWEHDIKANVITHEYFEQQSLYKEYIKPQIKDSENQQLDEDENGKDESEEVKES